MSRMEMQPFDFCTRKGESHLRSLIGFRHRTFNEDDLFYFVSFLKHHYSKNESLESAFTMHGESVEEMLSGFHHYFFSLYDAPKRTRKHIATPMKNSTCKRLNMFLRWMVRDDGIVDLGIWKTISPSRLIIPIDVHVARVARRLKLTDRKQTDWKTAVELTERLREFDGRDPVKYDFGLYALGMAERF